MTDALTPEAVTERLYDLLLDYEVAQENAGFATRLYAAIEKARAAEPDESEIGYGYDAHYAAFYRTLLAELGGNDAT